MEFGIGMFGDVGIHAPGTTFKPAQQRLAEMIDEVRLADELGIDVIAMGEHHRADYAVASTEVFLAALATVTKNIKLASGVTVLSSADPVKVFQDYATLDLLSNGRAEIIAGRGSFTESFPLYGYELWDYDELFSEKMDLLVQLNQQSTITWEGKFRKPLKNQPVFPRPLNGRQLPIWIAVGGTPESVHRAAVMGLPLMLAIIGGMPEQFMEFVNYYKKAYKQSGYDVAKMQLGIHSHTFISDSPQSLMNDYFPYYAAQMDRVGKQRGWAPYTRMQFEGGMGERGALFMGDSKQVANKIIRLVKMFGLTRFVAHMDVGDPGHEAMRRSIELFGKEVIPAVKKGLGID